MTTRFGLRRLLTLVALVLLWCGLWQGVSVANVLSGALVGTVVLTLGIGTSGVGGIRLWPMLKLLWLILVDLVKSTGAVAYEILTPHDYTEEAIVEFTVMPEARRHFLILIVAITLTPGTAVVDADPDTGRLYLHLLHFGRRADVADHVQELAQLTCEALPLPTPARGVAA